MTRDAKRIAGTALILALAGCGSGNTPYAGSQCVQYLDCSDGLRDCVEQVKQICPAGYHVLRDDDVGADFGDFARAHFSGAAMNDPHMLVTCTPPVR